MKKINSLVLSTLTAALLVGCGGGSSSTGTTTTSTTKSVTVERGAVIGATVQDSSTPPQEGKSSSNNNIYTFENDVVYPIVVSGGFIDVDGDGEYSAGDSDLTGLEMKSYSEVVTPVTTYIASKLSGISEDAREEAMTQAYEELASALGIENVDDLKKTPSTMGDTTSVIAVNAIYKELLESDSVEDFNLELLKEEFDDLKEIIGEEVDVKEIEKLTLQDIKDDNPDLEIKIATEDDVKSYINTYELFDYTWKEKKEFANGEYLDGNSIYLSESKDSLVLKAIYELDKRSKAEVKTQLIDLGSNSVSGTFELTNGGQRSAGLMKVFSELTLSGELNTTYSSLGNNKYFKVYTKVNHNRIYVGTEFGGDDAYIAGDGITLKSDLENIGESFTIETSFVDGVFKVSVNDYTETFEYQVPTGMTIGEFKSVVFTADVDATRTDVTEENAIINVTAFTAETKELSAAVQAMKIIENMDVEQDNVDTKLNEAKAKVNGLSSADAVMVASMLDLTSIINSNEVSNILEINTSASSIGETTDFAQLVKSTVDDTIEVNEKYNGISTNIRTILHNFATKLKDISDNIGSVFQDKDYVFEYGNEEIVYNDSLALRASILGLAAQLDVISAYSWGSDDDIKVQTYESNGYSYDYQNINVYSDDVLNSGTVFKIDSGSRIDTARAYLIEGLGFMNSLPVGYDEMTQDDKDEIAAILGSIQGGDAYEIVDEWTEWNGVEEVTYKESVFVDLSKLYNSTYAIDVTSFGSNFELECQNSGATFSENISKMYDSATCDDHYSADLVSGSDVTTSNSKLDDVFTKIIDHDENMTYTGQALIDNILE